MTCYIIIAEARYACPDPARFSAICVWGERVGFDPRCQVLVSGAKHDPSRSYRGGVSPVCGSGETRMKACDIEAGEGKDSNRAKSQSLVAPSLPGG